MEICKAPALQLKAPCKKISYKKRLKYQLVSFDSVFAVFWREKILFCGFF